MGVSGLKMMKKKVSIILPTYNEKENILELVRQVALYTGSNLLEIIVVDDNSPDGTWEIVQKLQKKYRNLRLVRRLNENGLPSAIWRGIKESKGNIVVWLDCDLSHPPQYIPKLLDYIDHYDIVCASRYVEKGKDTRSFVRVLASKMINIIAELVLGLKVKDLTSGFYAVRKDVFKKVKIMETGFAEYCIKFTYDALRQGFKIKEVGYISPNREKGASKTATNFSRFLNDGYLCIKEIMKLRFSR